MTPADGLRLGWQYATPYPDPGPPPPRPTPPQAERVNPEWAQAQRREERRLNRPLLVVVAAAVVVGLVLAVLGAAGSLEVLVAGLGVICCTLIAAVGGYAIWQGERALRSRLAQERARVARTRAAQESQLLASQEEHARQVREWQALRVAHEHQKRWYAVRAPGESGRVDVAGGTLPGWSAMLTTAGADRLAAGGEVTVVDLTEGSAALDLIGFARARGIEPQVWVLPEDLPRLDLPLGDALADVLSQAAGLGDVDGDSGPDLSLDVAILDRIVDALGGTATVASIAAALRVLAQVGDPRDDVASGLISAAQVGRLGAAFGHAAVGLLERAWVLESRLRKLASAGTRAAAGPRSALRVLALGQRVGAAEGRLLGTYLAVALAHGLRGTRPRQHTLFVLAADRLRGEVLDRLSDVCEGTGTGLVLAFRAIPPRIRQRLGRGNAAVAFMRLADAEDAKAASEQLGAGRRLVLSQLTETIGLSVTDTATGGYQASAASAASAASPASAGEAGEAGETGGESESVSASISSSTAWGLATSKAASDGESFALAMQRSRELLVEEHELRQLPASAMIISYAAPEGRQVVLADANPGIGGLPAATDLKLEEFRGTPAVLAGAGRPMPNVGPPPPRLDWRKRRS